MGLPSRQFLALLWLFNHDNPMPAKKSAKKTVAASKPAKTRQGQRAPGKTQTSISLSESILNWARGKADADGRSLSNWIEQEIRSKREAE
jgi:hypothetical protein